MGSGVLSCVGGGLGQRGGGVGGRVLLLAASSKPGGARLDGLRRRGFR